MNVISRMKTRSSMRVPGRLSRRGSIVAVVRFQGAKMGGRQLPAGILIGAKSPPTTLLPRRCYYYWSSGVQGLLTKSVGDSLAEMPRNTYLEKR